MRVGSQGLSRVAAGAAGGGRLPAAVGGGAGQNCILACWAAFALLLHFEFRAPLLPTANGLQLGRTLLQSGSHPRAAAHPRISSSQDRRSAPAQLLLILINPQTSDEGAAGQAGRRQGGGAQRHGLAGLQGNLPGGRQHQHLWVGRWQGQAGISHESSFACLIVGLT